MTKNCVSLMYTLADILRFKRQEGSLKGGVSTAALQLDTVARAVLPFVPPLPRAPADSARRLPGRSCPLSC